MTINWKIRENIVDVDEGSKFDYTIEYEPIDSKVSILSSTLPSSVSIINENGSGIVRVIGTLPHIGIETSYYLSMRLSNGTEFSDGYLKINCRNLNVCWDEEQKDVIEIFSSTEINEKLKLKNTNGNEIFKLTSGKLPNGLVLHENGVIIGNTIKNLKDETSEYKFSVDVFKDGYRLYDVDSPESLERQFTMIVKNASDISEPYWVTESGVIGNLNYNEKSTLKILAYDVDGSSASTIIYKLVNGTPNRVVAPGITLTPTGHLEGFLTTPQENHYDFEVIACKQINGVEIQSQPRLFTIKTNDLPKEHRINWYTDGVIDIGSYPIGSNVVGNIPLPTVEDGSVVTLKLNAGNIPKGLVLSPNGNLSGKLEYQDKGDYYFSIVAETKQVSSVRDVVMHLTKGIGGNALKMSFRINNEYRDEYIDIKSQLNPNTLYKQTDDNFKVDSFPCVDLAVLTCFDREVLSNMLNFGNDEVIRFGKTTSTEYVQVNNEGETIEHYEVVYKTLDESTYQWEEQDYGNYDFEGRLEYLKEIGEIDYTSELDFNNKTYKLDVKNGNVTNIVSQYEIFNFYNFRELLKTPIYVYKKEGTYYYSLGSQELIETSEIKDEYNLYKSKTDGKYRITKLDTVSFDDEIVRYENRKIYDSNNRFMANILFTECNILGENLIKSSIPFIIYETYDTPFYLKKITNPICFDRAKNTTITLNGLSIDKELVMPYITDDDVIDLNTASPYIVFLDETVERLPEWKRKKTEYWQPNKQYIAGDVLLYDAVYYECLQEFKSGSHFIFDENLFKVLTNDEIQAKNKIEYFPTLELGYFEPNTNRYYLSQLNEAEDRGEYWNNRDFYMYELTCEPMFNKELETFVIQLNPKMNKQFVSYVEVDGFDYNLHNDDAILVLKSCKLSGDIELPIIKYEEVIDE